MQGCLYAAAVDTGSVLYRVLLVRRDPKTDIYVPILGAAHGMDTHASWHRDGRGHQKTGKYEFFHWRDSKPDETFTGARNLLTTGVAKHVLYAVIDPALIYRI